MYTNQRLLSALPVTCCLWIYFCFDFCWFGAIVLMHVVSGWSLLHIYLPRVIDSRRIAEALSGRPQHGRDRLEPVYRVVKDQPSFTIQQQLKVTRVTNTESA